MCLLTKDDLSERSPNAGDVVYNVLQLLIRDAQSLQRTLPSSPITPTSRYSYTYPATNWHFMQQNAEIYHSTLRQSSTQQFLNNSVTLSPAPSIDSQAGSPKTESNNHANQVCIDFVNLFPPSFRLVSKFEEFFYEFFTGTIPVHFFEKMFFFGDYLINLKIK